MTAFLVPRGTPGLSVGPRHKLGVRRLPCDLTFSACRVPQDAVLGAPGEGLPIAFGSLERGRVGIAAQALGIAQACLDARPRPGQSQAPVRAPPGRIPGGAVRPGGHGPGRGGRPPADLPRARPSGRRAPRRGRSLHGQALRLRSANRAATKAVQPHGALGYMQEGTVERYFATPR